MASQRKQLLLHRAHGRSTVPRHSKGEVCPLRGLPLCSLWASSRLLTWSTQCVLTLTAPESCGQVGMIQQIQSSQQNVPQGQTYTGTECSAGHPPDGHTLIYKIPLGRLYVRVMSLHAPIRLFNPKSLCHHTLNSWLSSRTRSSHTANTAYKHAFEKEKRTQQRSSWLPWDPFSTLTWWVLSISITVICD